MFAEIADPPVRGWCEITRSFADWKPYTNPKTNKQGWISGGGLVRYTKPKDTDGSTSKPAGASKIEEKVASRTAVAAVQEKILGGRRLTAAVVKALPGHLQNLTVPELKAFRAAVSASKGGTRKAEIAATLLDLAKTRAAGAEKPKPVVQPEPDKKPPEPPVPVKPSIDYKHKDASHQVVQSMLADKDLSAKVQEFHTIATVRAKLAKKHEQLAFDAKNAGWRYDDLLNDPNPTRKGYQAELERAAVKRREAEAAEVDARKALQEVKDNGRKKLLEIFKTSDPSKVSALPTDPPGLPPINKQPPMSSRQAKLINTANEFASTITGGNGDYAYHLIRSHTGRAFCRDVVGNPKPAQIATGLHYGTLSGQVVNGKRLTGSKYSQERALSTQVHEIGHMIETRKPGVLQKVQDFLAYRVGDEQPVPMASVKGNANAGYGPSEMGRKDNFNRAMPLTTAYYVGKQYPDGATEVLSMGIQLLHDDPITFAAKDPEYFHFILSVLK